MTIPLLHELSWDGDAAHLRLDDDGAPCFAGDANSGCDGDAFGGIHHAFDHHDHVYRDRELPLDYDVRLSVRCNRCREFFPAGAGHDPNVRVKWWLCTPCQATLIGDRRFVMDQVDADQNPRAT